VRPGNPPTLIQHGTDDAVAPVSQVRWFRDVMVEAGNVGLLVEYERAAHAFHYPGPAGHFDHVIDLTAEFLLNRLAAAPPAPG
jgi:acetyl esterase